MEWRSDILKITENLLDLGERDRTAWSKRERVPGTVFD